MRMEDGHEDGDGSGDRNRGQQVQLGSSRLWEYAARSHFSLAASLCNSNISSSNIDIDDVSDRRMSLSSSVCCPVFFFVCLFLERHILMMSRVESPCHRFTTNSDSELASISCGCCCNKGNANLCVSLWMLFLGLALNTLVYRVADRERGICFRSLRLVKNSLRFLA